MMGRAFLVSATGMALLGGCVTKSSGPLVFVVTHTVGVDIQATSASSATPGLTVGYKSIDLAVVPTQAEAGNSEPRLLGCYSVGQNGNDAPVLCGSTENAKAVVQGKSAHTAGQSTFPDFGVMQESDTRISNALLTDDVQTKEPAFFRNIVAPAVLPAAPSAVPATGSAGSADGGKFAESIVDAYSVYASFNTSAKAGGSAPGVGIGEVFATGDAAVQLAEAINYYSSREGNADIIKAQGASTCVAQLTAAKQAGVDMSKVPDCPSPVTQSNPAPTLSNLQPPSGAAPAAGASAGTVVALTLTGTGFNAASEVTVLGAAGLTLDKPKPASDGKTMTVNLTIAPGAATGTRGLFVANPSPGGGTTTTQPFTVN